MTIRVLPTKPPSPLQESLVEFAERLRGDEVAVGFFIAYADGDVYRSIQTVDNVSELAMIAACDLLKALVMQGGESA